MTGIFPLHLKMHFQFISLYFPTSPHCFQFTTFAHINHMLNILFTFKVEWPLLGCIPLNTSETATSVQTIDINKDEQSICTTYHCKKKKKKKIRPKYLGYMCCQSAVRVFVELFVLFYVHFLNFWETFATFFEQQQASLIRSFVHHTADRQRNNLEDTLDS